MRGWKGRREYWEGRKRKIDWEGKEGKIEEYSIRYNSIIYNNSI